MGIRGIEMDTTDLIFECYPMVKNVLDDIKTKTMYGKFLKTAFDIYVSKKEEGDSVTFYFLMKMDLLIAGEISPHKIQCLMYHGINELQNQELRSEIVHGFDSMITESIRRLTYKCEFESMHINVYNNGPVGRFKHPESED